MTKIALPDNSSSLQQLNASFLLGDLEEELVKGAASGDLLKCEIILKTKGSNVSFFASGPNTFQTLVL